MELYADVSSTGFNLMDMTQSEMILIRDSLIRASQASHLDADNRLKIKRITQEIDRAISSAKLSSTNLKVLNK